MEPIGRLTGCEKAALPDMRLSFVWQMVYNITVYEMGLSGQVALLRGAKAHRR